MTKSTPASKPAPPVPPAARSGAFPLMRHTYINAEQDKLINAAADKLGWSYSQFLRRSAESAARSTLAAKESPHEQAR